jgi:hypothetical protein
MVHPVRCGAAGAEGFLQAVVETFHHPIRLRVRGCCLAVLDVEQSAQGGPQGGGELGPEV